MADSTYDAQAKIYLKQGASEQVIANGGTQTIESGGKTTLESGGEIEGQSGSYMDLQAGFLFYLNGDSSSFGVDKLYNAVRSMNTLTRYINSQGAGSTVMSVSIFSPAYGYAIVKTSGTSVSALSLKLPTPSVGMFLEIHLSGCISNTALSIFGQSAGGASVVDLSGAVISSLNAASTAAGLVKLGCFTDSVWTILDIQGHISANAPS